MNILGLLLLVILISGCQKDSVSSSVASPVVMESHQHEEDHADEHEDEEGVLHLSESQRKTMRLTTQPVVVASQRTSGIRPGRIEADPDRQAVISSLVSGTLQTVSVSVGGHVSSGASVAVLSSPEVTSWQAEYHEAEVEAELARKELANKNELFRVGDEVNRPMETARLELSEARAKRDAAQAKLKSAVLKNERMETLLSEGIASKQQVEESQAERQSLEADLRQAQTEVEIAQSHLERERRVTDSQLNIKSETFPAQARLARALEQMRHTQERIVQVGASPEAHDGKVNISSPLSGTVVERKFSRGEMVASGAPIAVVVDTSKVWAWIDLQRSDMESVGLGDVVEVSLVEKPGVTERGTLDYVSPQLNKESQTLRARVSLPGGTKFPIGSFVNARLESGAVGQASNSLAVPQGAVQMVEGQTVVYLVQGDGYRRTPVVLGPPVGEDQVTVSGLKAGEMVVVQGVEQLKSLDLADSIGGHSH